MPKKDGTLTKKEHEYTLALLHAMSESDRTKFFNRRTKPEVRDAIGNAAMLKVHQDKIVAWWEAHKETRKLKRKKFFPSTWAGDVSAQSVSNPQPSMEGSVMKSKNKKTPPKRNGKAGNGKANGNGINKAKADKIAADINARMEAEAKAEAKAKGKGKKNKPGWIKETADKAAEAKAKAGQQKGRVTPGAGTVVKKGPPEKPKDAAPSPMMKEFTDRVNRALDLMDGEFFDTREWVVERLELDADASDGKPKGVWLTVSDVREMERKLAEAIDTIRKLFPLASKR